MWLLHTLRHYRNATAAVDEKHVNVVVVVVVVVVAHVASLPECCSCC